MLVGGLSIVGSLLAIVGVLFVGFWRLRVTVGRVSTVVGLLFGLGVGTGVPVVRGIVGTVGVGTVSVRVRLAGVFRRLALGFGITGPVSGL